MGRRIKAKARSAATYRLRQAGIEPEPGKLPTPTADDELVVAKLYPAFFAAAEALKAQRKVEEKALVKATERLPIMAWASKVRGLGTLSVATLIGEAVDPGRYNTPSKLWKRYGLAVIDGRAQRRVKDAEQALEHGYNAERRAAIYVIGENLIRVGNKYARAIYDERKAIELAKTDANGQPITKAHAHKRALRIIQKRLALAFWLAWRQTAAGEPLSERAVAFMAAEG